MLKFEPVTLSSLQKILPYIRNMGVPCSDLSAGSLFMWRDGTNLQFCEWNDTLIVQQDRGEQPAFSWPIGKDPNGMIAELLEYVKNNHLPLRFFAVDENILNNIRNDIRLTSPMWAFDPRWSDYVYSFEEAKNFSGRKYSGQRNHINRFKKLYGDPDIRFLKAEDLPAVFDMLSEYASEHTGANQLELLELENTRELLSVYDSLGLYAAGLFVQGQIAAFGIGELANDMFLIHVEKALKRYEGAYPTMYSGFVNLIASLPGVFPKIVNREDDSGDPGIRTSKMQYHPIRQIDKYLVHIDSPASKITSPPKISAGNVVLTPFRETDRNAYYDLCTDIQNNRYWGYDYRTDAGITGPIDEETFYNSTMLDMQAGDSINFAIRLTPDGEMIGEAILWNFTADRRAELGCRILPSYQRNGYGKAAFQAALDYAENCLQVHVYARCFHENIASYRMITACGFETWYKDEIYQYFKRKSKTII